MKRWLLALALVATLVAAYFAPSGNESRLVLPAKTSTSQLRETSPTTKTALRPKPQLGELRIHPRTVDQDLGNVFAGQSWTPPPPPPPPMMMGPPPPPVAPPLPFKFLGRFLDKGKTTYFLSLNDRNLALQIGDSVDQRYTLESFNGGTLTFTYLPLHQKQTLVVGDVN